jgi:hypothetical protein
MSPDRIVLLGGIDERSQDARAELYAPFVADRFARTHHG